MPTIKKIVRMNLPELIEWGWKNDIKKATYRSENGLSVNFSFDGKAVIGYAFSKADTFTVEVEEPITEDTVLGAVVIVRKQISPYDRESTHVCRKGNVSINQVLSLQPNNSRFVYLEIHLMKNDRIDQLIWTKEKGLVE
ncbi:hypothetical protein [Mammaliicoccus sciuri]|uniref:hypothetical protein n=1 Tax=Mammaliicoccus sciuri TaxID=1296 RepID=UPI001FB4E042|nr:hypothetical protein [Mammaliicoccus sciuri]MCJ1785209.1 hypothetical protein [Mammaliicoccus sciuri]